MIKFERFELENGLRVVVHQDKSTPIVAINVLYNVGSRDEDPQKTGFAHLFEHLMFGGSLNIPNFDEELQKVGGENNAFTSNDITNYYLTLPKYNIETAFWLESDRMLSLAFTEKSLEVQRNVVIEEFKQRYLNQPYGDAWLLLKPLAYKTHPYRWCTIGMEIAHIENAVMDDVRNFFKKFYAPNNAILTVAGDVNLEQVKLLAQKWFGSIPPTDIQSKNFIAEPKQNQARFLSVQREVPLDAIYKAFHIGSRTSYQYYVADLITDLLSRGDSSRLYRELVKNKKIFSDINAYLTGDTDPGLLIVSGKLVNGISIELAEKAIDDELAKLKQDLVDEQELNKVKNKIESTLAFSEMNVANIAMNLAIAENLGDVNLINTEIHNYLKVSPTDILEHANKIFISENSSTLHYLSKKE